MGVARLPRTEIDVPGLTRVGDAVTDVAARMAATARDIEGWSYQGQGAFEGSLVCASNLSHTAHTWALEIREMSGAVRKLGEDLKRTAADYQAYDQLTAQQLRQIY